MNTYDLREAASTAKIHPDTLRKMAASKKLDRPPGTKIGRAWIFPVHLFDSWIENKCLSTVAVARPTGGVKSQSLASRLERRLALQIGKKRKNSSTESENDSGDSTS
jgi:hypothetical protein